MLRIKYQQTLALIICCPLLSLAAFDIPPLTGPVIDLADLIDSHDEVRLESALRSLNQSGSAQLQILTVPSLQGEPIEEVSYKVVKEWKLGTEKKDNGLLFLISSKDRRLRIEVGQGLEGQIPDVYAKRIVSDVVIPYFKRGESSEGIVAGVAQLIQLTKGESDLVVARPPRSSRSSYKKIEPFLIFIIFILLALFGPRRRGFGRRIYGSAGGWGSTGHFGGFGGSGGGGWGGSGGGFSGGGASGSW